MVVSGRLSVSSESVATCPKTAQTISDKDPVVSVYEFNECPHAKTHHLVFCAKAPVLSLSVLSPHQLEAGELCKMAQAGGAKSICENMLGSKPGVAIRNLVPLSIASDLSDFPPSYLK